MEKNQTAVEWLLEKMRTEWGIAISDNVTEQAKRIEQEQIKDAYGYGVNAHKTGFCNRMNTLKKFMENNQTMKAQDLRIGNLVNLRDEIVSISSVSTSHLSTFINRCNFAERHFSYDNIQPIPLTEEWLLRMGFTNIDTTSIYVKSMHKIGTNKLKSLAVYINEDNYTVAIVDYYTGVEKTDLLHLDYKSVHQLQNLYYALTNQELEIKSEIEKL